MRFVSLCGFGAALVCAAFLVACGGGGSGSTPGSGGSLTGSHATTGKGPGTTMTVVINRTKHTNNKASHSGPRSTKSRAAQAISKSGPTQASSRRSPKYIEGNAQGLQITVSATGVASQTVYADITSSSICSSAGPIETCVISVPTIAANEQFTILETDTMPQNSTNGYGTGFASGDILGALQQSASVQLGAANNVALEIGPVAAQVYDDSDYVANCFTIPTSVPVPYSTNFGVDETGVNRNGEARIVVTANVAASGGVYEEFENYNGDCYDPDPTPAPFVDVNASPEPITLTSNNSALTVAPMINNGTAPPASAYAATASLPNDGYYWQDCFFVVGVKVASTLSSPQTMTLSNNLTATPPFGGSPYTSTYTYTVVPISVSPTTATVSADGTTLTATVTGSDYGAYYGMDATSAYENYDYDCNTSGGTTLANISTGSINTTTWQQSFTIAGINNGTGTCTFYLNDDWSATLTQAVTVTVQ
jgi:hypothetical protein